MLQLSINEALINKSPILKELVDSIKDIESKEDLGESILYHNFPLYPKEDSMENYKPDLMLVTQNYGILIFKTCENESDIEKFHSDLQKTENILYARILKDSSVLIKQKRTLKFDIQSAFFIKDSKKNDYEDIRIVTSEQGIIDMLTEFADQTNPQLTSTEYNDLLATIEGAKAIQRQTSRAAEQDAPTIKGAIYDRVEKEITSFDFEQKKFALIISDGPQRLRGLAGSGKTIILAMKVALLHISNPRAKILYTYYTKALGDIVTSLVLRFHRQLTDREPNWDKIDILHAWGGKYLEGVYYNTARINGQQPLSFDAAMSLNSKNPFDAICSQLIRNELKKTYDYTFLDEGQDFPTSFYRLCRQITKNNNIVWAYDDFQNILDITLQDEKETFGKDSYGRYHIDFSRNPNSLQDIILHKCYRNPRKILIAAFSLGLGIYNKKENSQEPRLVQRLEDNKHWESLGFELEEGDSSPGCQMIITRPNENSFEAKNRYLDNESEIIKIKKYNNIVEECAYVLESIKSDIKEKLKPEDITVICLDDSRSKRYFSHLSQLLQSQGIQPFNLQEAPSTNTIFKKKGYVTLSTVYKAKGNEAANVYILGADSVFIDKDNVQERNKLFTAITRSQAWVSVSGCGDAMDNCITEYEQLRANKFKMIFIQPTREEVLTIMQGTTERQKALNKIWKLAGDAGMDPNELIKALTKRTNQENK